MGKINECEEMNAQHFWVLVNSNKKKVNSIHPLKLKNGELVTKTGDIKDEWKRCFEEVYTPKMDPKYDIEYMKRVDDEIEKPRGTYI